MKGAGLRAAAVGLFVLVGSLVSAPVASAGFAVQPGDGSTVTTPYPSFLVYIGDGETLAEVQVSTSPDNNDFGFVSLKDLCFPTTPFGDAHKFSCKLSLPLSPGTYYWAYTYEAQSCKDFSGFQYCGPTPQFSGPFRFTVGEPTAPSGTSLVTPYDGATVGTMPTLAVLAPAGASLEIYAADSDQRLNDGTPAGLAAFSCSGTTDTEDTYTCRPSSTYDLTPGETYWWWAVVEVDGTRWIYGPRSFTVGDGSSGGSASNGGEATHQIGGANFLPRSDHFTGRSIKQMRLTNATYGLTKLIGTPKTISVACWNAEDWPGISGDSGDSLYSTLGLYNPSMPHWIHLSPGICRAIETLLYHRPATPNKYIAAAVDTVTHEMIHALGIRNEARTECLAMQISPLMAWKLGVPASYAVGLARLNLANYSGHPPRYVDYYRCREGGAWDIDPEQPSLPWHAP